MVLSKQMVMGFSTYSGKEVDVPDKKFQQRICQCLHGDSIHEFVIKDGGKRMLTNCNYHGCGCTQYKEHIYSPNL